MIRISIYKEKLCHLKQLMRLADSDEEIHPLERHYLETLAEQLKIDAEDFKRVERNDLDLDLPRLRLKTIQLYYRVLFLMKLDGTIDGREVEFAVALGEKLMLNKEACKELIEEIQQNPDEPLSIVDVECHFGRFEHP